MHSPIYGGTPRAAILCLITADSIRPQLIHKWLVPRTLGPPPQLGISHALAEDMRDVWQLSTYQHDLLPHTINNIYKDNFLYNFLV